MIPSVLVGLDSFALTSSGKVDRIKLVEDYAGRASTRSPGRHQSETERRVTEVWTNLLGHGDIRPDSSFFEVGGTSLTVFAAVHRLRDAFKLDRGQFSDQSIYRFPTVEGLASYIDSLVAGSAPVAASQHSLLVTLKRGDDATLPPFFVIASAGGTLGTYEKLVRALKTRRDVIGVRDPFIWGDRDPTLGFQSWVRLYVDAIRERQPLGPYYLGAYSSAGAFGYEVARHLRRKGEEVALLALIDPLAIDRETKRRFGYWAFRARFMRRSFERIVRLGGWLRLAPLASVRDTSLSARENDAALTQEQFLQLAAEARKSRGHILGFSGLLELTTGLPFALTDAELSRAEPDQYLAVLLARVRSIAPEIDPGSIENIVIQYYLQTRAQHVYRLQRYGGTVVIVEPDGPYKGLLAAVFRPYVGELRALYLKLGSPSLGTRTIAERFSANLRAHYLCLRDDEFVKQLSEELEVLLR
jgi:hypothetical protein